MASMFIWIKRIFIGLLKFQNSKLESLACNAMQWRGFSNRPIHPKHLFDTDRPAIYSHLLKPGIAFLDLGSGMGTDCILAAQSGAARVVGIENNSANCQVAIQRAMEVGVSVEFIQKDLEKASLPFDDRTFDLVLFSNVLEHLHNRILILQELRRVKKPEGIAVISIPNADTPWKQALRSTGLDSRDDPDHKIEYTPASLDKELHTAGLERITPLQPIVPSFPWHGVIALSAAFSPALYRLLQAYKRHLAIKHPEESIGWVFEVR